MGECGSVGEAGIRRVRNAIREKGNNRGGAIRKVGNSNSIATALLVTIISIVELRKRSVNVLLHWREDRPIQGKPS